MGNNTLAVTNVVTTCPFLMHNNLVIIPILAVIPEELVSSHFYHTLFTII